MGKNKKVKIERPITLAIGDLVTYISGQRPTSLAFNDVRVVTEAAIHNGEIAYGVGGAAWFSRSDLKFVSKATEASVELAKSQAEDDDDAGDDCCGDDDRMESPDSSNARSDICSGCGYMTGGEGDRYKCFVSGTCPARSGYVGDVTKMGRACNTCSHNPSNKSKRSVARKCNVAGFCPFVAVIHLQNPAKSKPKSKK